VELQTQALGRIQHKLFEGVLKEFIFLYRNKTHPKYFLKLKIIYIYIYTKLYLLQRKITKFGTKKYLNTQKEISHK